METEITLQRFWQLWAMGYYLVSRGKANAHGSYTNGIQSRMFVCSETNQEICTIHRNVNRAPIGECFYFEPMEGN